MSVVEQALGVKWRRTVEISHLVFGGTAVAYVITVGDIIMEPSGDGINGLPYKRL
jgi:hypothetical protein